MKKPDERDVHEYSHSEWERMTEAQREVVWDRHWENEARPQTQAEHDASHPGKVCQLCPSVIAFELDLKYKAERLRAPWWKKWLW